jgi:hypothetical protein
MRRFLLQEAKVFTYFNNYTLGNSLLLVQIIIAKLYLQLEQIRVSTTMLQVSTMLHHEMQNSKVEVDKNSLESVRTKFATQPQTCN